MDVSIPEYISVPVTIIVALLNFYYIRMLYIRSNNGDDYSASPFAQMEFLSNYKRFLRNLDDEEKRKRYKKVLYSFYILFILFLLSIIPLVWLIIVRDF